MKSKIYTPFVLPILAVIAIVTAFSSQDSEARPSSFDCHLTVVDYYGKLCNSDRQTVYGAKVYYNNFYYYVEMEQPMSCLRHRINHEICARIYGSRNYWHTVTYDGHTTPIYQIVKLGDCAHARSWTPKDNHKGGFFSDVFEQFRSPFYYDN